ncbi:MAG: RsiV family protein, partial [Paeniclostridium sordellii]|nr:RsiV family protein [Paeniclostridium sordellii]
MYRFKKFIFYISISTLAIIFLFIVIGTQYESKIDLKNLKTSIIQGFKSVRIKEEKYKLNYDGITFAINMPIVEYEDKNIERYINTYIRKNVNQFINLKKQQRDISPNHDDVKVKINFHTAFEDKNLLNIIIYKDIYIKEKNYERIKDSYVFDLKTGQRVYIDNFLKNNEDYEYVLENYILSKIDKNKIDINKNKITINKYTNYYITDEGIGIYFNPYQISK